MHDDAVQSAIWLVRGAWVTMTLRAGCLLGVFDELGETPVSPAEVAGRTECDPDAMARFLRVLVDLGLAESRGDSYLATDVGATFGTTHPSHLRELVLMQTDLATVATWHELEAALRTGAGVYERVNGVSHWEHLAAQPDAERTFNAAMARRGTVQAAALLEAVDLDGVASLVDVGGGRGAMLAAILEQRPGLTGVVADRPPVAEEATDHLAASGLGDRARGVGCDFFTSVPDGADVYTMAHVLHDWTDQECIEILRTVRAAMSPQARLLVLERVLGAPGRPPAQERDLHLMDLHMLVLFGARERTQAEYDVLLQAAGFTPSRLAGSGDWNVLEARPAS
jgi:O-methyltransferase domain/Dimerisation domain